MVLLIMITMMIMMTMVMMMVMVLFQAHSCVEKAGMIGFVKMRQLDVDEKFSLRGHVLERAIEVNV